MKTQWKVLQKYTLHTLLSHDVGPTITWPPLHGRGM